jgi:hypothetical protein
VVGSGPGEGMTRPLAAARQGVQKADRGEFFLASADQKNKREVRGKGNAGASERERKKGEGRFDGEGE